MSKNKIIIRSYSKAVFLYPTLLISIIGWIMQYLYHTPLLWLEVLWTATFFTNLLIIVFDFSPTKFLLLFIICAAAGVLFWYYALIPFQSYLDSINMSFGYTVHFYIVMTGVCIFLYLIALISPLFDYYIIERNELYHRQGIFTKAERYAISNISFDKEIPDIFEFLLLGAGRIVFYPEGGRRLIRLDTVIRVNSKEERLNTILSKILVDSE